MGRTLRNFENKPLTQNNDIVGVYNTRTNTLEQLTDYYPYGLPHASISSEVAGAEVNRRKFGGKELMSDHGYNSYDFAARHQNPAFPHFTTPDPLAEKFKHLSPHLFCASDPINLIDPTGMDIWHINLMGEIVNRIEDKKEDKLVIVDADCKPIVDGNGKNVEITFAYGTIERQRTIAIDSKNSYDIYQIRGDENATKAFEFLSNNLSVNPEDIEFSLIRTGEKDDKGLNFITTSHTPRSESGIVKAYNGQLITYFIREFTHSHPNMKNASDPDISVAGGIQSNSSKKYSHKILFRIYHVPSKNYFIYEPLKNEKEKK